MTKSIYNKITFDEQTNVLHILKKQFGINTFTFFDAKEHFPEIDKFHLISTFRKMRYRRLIKVVGVKRRRMVRKGYNIYVNLYRIRSSTNDIDI